ncbi:MAG: thiaminase II [Chloroflexota bacterium]|nr:thiaminase II [Chloroflexota bacterium]
MSQIDSLDTEASDAPSFAATLWNGIAPLYDAILDHPFLVGLTDGTLDEAAFRFYVVQDARYLDGYARALSIAAARAPRSADVAMFNRHAAGAMEVERSLHEELLGAFGLDASEVRDTPPAPTTLAYTSYLLATAYAGSFAEALGALLPCYWIYWEVGKTLLATGSAHPLYARWIATYGGEEYGQIVRDVLALTERVGEGLSASERLVVTERFNLASRYEWMFWEMAYRQERWPLTAT